MAIATNAYLHNTNYYYTDIFSYFASNYYSEAYFLCPIVHLNASNGHLNTSNLHPNSSNEALNSSNLHCNISNLFPNTSNRYSNFSN